MWLQIYLIPSAMSQSWNISQEGSVCVFERERSKFLVVVVPNRTSRKSGLPQIWIAQNRDALPVFLGSGEVAVFTKTDEPITGPW